jgi:hypothetical protein
MVWRSVILVSALLLTSPCAGAGDEGPACEPRTLFQAADAEGAVWANLGLTQRRVDAAYLPIVIGIQNLTQGSVKIRRDSIWLVDLDGVIYTMPTVKALRNGYDETLADHRLVSFDGIPWLNWRRGRRFEPSNFFPDMRAVRGNTTKDRVTLRSGFGMVDLFYFERPRGLRACRPFYVVVHAEGWQTPVRFPVFIP